MRYAASKGYELRLTPEYGSAGVGVLVTLILGVTVPDLEYAPSGHSREDWSGVGERFGAP